jgi:hypothetical protein
VTAADGIGNWEEETLNLSLYTSLVVTPHVSAGLTGLRMRVCFFLIREALPVGHNFLSAPVPAGTGSRPYPRPPGRVPTGTRILVVRCHL